MQFKTSSFFNSIKFIVFISLPIIFIAGNFLVNITYTVLFFLAIYQIYKKKFFFITSNKKIYFFFLIFFLIIFFASIYNYVDIRTTLKGLFYSRFILSTISIVFIIALVRENQTFIGKNFYMYLMILFCLDIFLQYFTGFNILNYRPGMCDAPYYENCQRFAGLFDDELIAGTFVSIFSWLAVYFYLEDNKKPNVYLLNLLLLFFLITILITGDRAPALNFVISIFIFNLLYNNLKKNIIILLVISTITVSTIVSIPHIQIRYVQIITILAKLYTPKNIFEKNIEHLETDNTDYESPNILYPDKVIVKNDSLFSYNFFLNNPWGAHYVTAIEMIKEKPIFGSGYKSFRIECHKYNYLLNHERFSNCSTHPHNFYFEIITDFGLIGLLVFLSIIFYVVFDFIKLFKKDGKNLHLIISFSLLVGFLFPLKPTGSILSTWTAGLFWILMAFYIYESCRVKLHK